MKRFVFSPKAIYTYKEIDEELERLISELSTKEKLDVIRLFHSA